MLTQEVSDSSGYSFTADYVSPHLAVWSRVLGPHAQRTTRMLEIGAYEGRSTVWFLANVLAQAESELTCVDIFSEARWELRFDHNVQISGAAAKVQKLKGRSGDLLPGLPANHYDVIYVDGSHEAGDVLLDALLCWPLLKPDGILIFDDYLWMPGLPPSQRPQLAIDLFLHWTAGRYELLHQEYQLIIRKHDSNDASDAAASAPHIRDNRAHE